MLSKAFAMSAVLAFCGLAQAVEDLRPLDQSQTTYVAMHNFCDFDTYYNLWNNGSVALSGKLTAKDGTHMKLPIAELKGYSQGRITLGKTNSSDVTGLGFEWDYVKDAPNLLYRFELDPNEELLPYHNQLNVTNPTGLPTLCPRYDCDKGNSKCYWTKDNAVDRLCPTRLAFDIALCSQDPL